MRYPPARRTLALLCLAAWPAWAAAVNVGDQAPDFVLPGQPDEQRLSALRGKLVYLDFWASWCGPCKQSFPWMSDLQARLGARGLQVLAVNVDASRAAAERFLATAQPRFAVAFDPQGRTPLSYGVKGMPTSVLIGPDGKVLYVHSGFRADERALLEAQITKALARTGPGS